MQEVRGVRGAREAPHKALRRLFYGASEMLDRGVSSEARAELGNAGVPRCEQVWNRSTLGAANAWGMGCG